ncbi:MAG TPA: Gfo/Idh/MocA family oxidoreductase [Methanothrix sp.]|jgi:predicted dehydrogenase|uniref:Gfo/Idh/MocA family oxidoreductase n=1 Tax=Methanothrix sp. TaxID=90426 RepID=UPI001BD254EB|nr:Gfo/Idh/MocA family oxidoreductase [Methanothrix sp.]MDI9417671.1 Gfo/Idh/MocA family oxidoreductase [Euryarchaeota archaeon]HON34818.1 Gfo/Idh/MocA family oxidoreductase [Methanothrix sp.]HRU76192.1 Gfo/Idh/MocA family oxidoreductase [Methanothrix sp.]
MDVGVLGVGAMGRNHVRVYSELKGVDTVYVYDPVQENAQRASEFATVCRSSEELLARAEAVSICVPTRYHFELAREAVKAGVNCLIEKPITLTVQEGERLLEEIEKSDLTVGVGHIERFNPIVEEIKKIAQRPDYVSIKRHNPTSNRITDASVVEDLMIHDIDIVFNVLFKGVEDYQIFSAGSRNVCEAMAVFSDSVVSISASRLSSKKFRTFYVEAEEFTTEGDFMTQEVYIYRKPGKYRVEGERYLQENIIEKVLVAKVEPLKVELKTFLDCIRQDKSFPVTPQEGLKNLEICERIKSGLKSGLKAEKGLQ